MFKAVVLARTCPYIPAVFACVQARTLLLQRLTSSPLKRSDCRNRVCHCFAEAVFCTGNRDGTASAKQWHTHFRRAAGTGGCGTPRRAFPTGSTGRCQQDQPGVANRINRALPTGKERTHHNRFVRRPLVALGQQNAGDCPSDPRVQERGCVALCSRT